MKNYTLTLNEQELQAVFNALVEQPFKAVAPLVAKIQEVYRNNENKQHDTV